MPAQLILGKPIAQSVRDEIKQKTAKLIQERGIQPGLATVLVGQDPGSQVYVRSKRKISAELGFYSEGHDLPENTTMDELLKVVRDLNQNPKIHGILVQLPLPSHLQEKIVIETIDPNKDVDGLHPMNMGKLVLGNPAFVSCTPAGCIKMIETTGIPIKGKHAVVVGRSNIVGKPLAHLLLAQHATVTICHSRTVDLGAVTRQADILCVAIGRANMITGDMIKPGAIVIDIGMNRLNDKLTGDVEFASAVEVAGYITPVPGGVGPMTIAMLMSNTYQAAERSGQ